MSGPSDDLFDEGRVRRALRLEANELPPRIDLAAIAARAQRTDPGTGAASVLTSGISAFAAAALVVFVATAVTTQLPALATTGLAGAIGLLARLAVTADGALGVAQEPTVPIALLAATLFAAVYEYAQRRERVRVFTTS